RYGPRTTSVLLVGDLDAERGLAAASSAFGRWSSAAVPPPVPPPAPHGPARVVIVDRPGAPQSELRVGHLGLAWSTKDLAAPQLPETVLGGSFTSRLNQTLRERHGYSYGARAEFQLLRAPGPFVAAAAVRTDVTAAALRETVAELAAISAPIADDELGKG